MSIENQFSQIRCGKLKLKLAPNLNIELILQIFEKH